MNCTCPVAVLSLFVDAVRGPYCLTCNLPLATPPPVSDDDDVDDHDPTDPSDIVPAGHFERTADWLKNGHARYLALQAELAAVKAERDGLQARTDAAERECVETTKCEWLSLPLTAEQIVSVAVSRIRHALEATVDDRLGEGVGKTIDPDNFICASCHGKTPMAEMAGTRHRDGWLLPHWCADCRSQAAVAWAAAPMIKTAAALPNVGLRLVEDPDGN